MKVAIGKVGRCSGIDLENQEGVRVAPQHKNGDGTRMAPGSPKGERPSGGGGEAQQLW
jgi:hypothetical protein